MKEYRIIQTYTRNSIGVIDGYGDYYVLEVIGYIENELFYGSYTECKNFIRFSRRD